MVLQKEGSYAPSRRRTEADIRVKQIVFFFYGINFKVKTSYIVHISLSRNGISQLTNEESRNNYLFLACTIVNWDISMSKWTSTKSISNFQEKIGK